MKVRVFVCARCECMHTHVMMFVCAYTVCSDLTVCSDSLCCVFASTRCVCARTRCVRVRALVGALSVRFCACCWAGFDDLPFFRSLDLQEGFN